MTKNRTSAVLQAHVETAQNVSGYVISISKTEFLAIAERCRKLEEALKISLKIHKMAPYKLTIGDRAEAMAYIQDALEFDPLNS